MTCSLFPGWVFASRSCPGQGVLLISHPEGSPGIWVYPLTFMHVLWAKAPLAEALSDSTLLNSTLQFDRWSGPWVLLVTLPLWSNQLSPLRGVGLSTLRSLRYEWVVFLRKPFLMLWLWEVVALYSWMFFWVPLFLLIRSGLVIRDPHSLSR